MGKKEEPKISGEIKMKGLMKELLQKYIKPVPLLILAVCIYAGYLIASDSGTASNNFFWLVLTGVAGGVLFAYGYVEKKYQIFLWALVGTAIASAPSMVQGENHVLFSNLFLEIFYGAFVGLLVEQNHRGVAIGALVMGLLFGCFAFWGLSSGGVYFSDTKITNGSIAIGMSFVYGAWRGALFGGIIGESRAKYKTRKQI